MAGGWRNQPGDFMAAAAGGISEFVASPGGDDATTCDRQGRLDETGRRLWETVSASSGATMILHAS
jgi:hypothetical protein